MRRDEFAIKKAVSSAIETYSLGYCYHLISLQHYYDHRFTALVVLNEQREGMEAIQRVPCKAGCSPTRVSSGRMRGMNILLPYAASHVPKSGNTMLYVCRDGACLAPVTGTEAIEKAIWSYERELLPIC